VSTRVSPDGMYYWDGQSWVSTLSHDGRFRWNGTAWVPVASQPFAPVPYQAPPAARQPTSWTLPMQYAVAGWYAISAVYTLTLPFWMGGMMSTIMTQSFRRQEQLNPNVTPPPPEFIQAMTTFMNGVLWVSTLVGVAICALFIVGALKRWRWAFYVVLVLLGLGSITAPLNLINIVDSRAYDAAVGFSLPTGLYVTSLILWIPGAALFVWMLVAAIKRGPWAMTRVS